jgi:hypothetical protein
MIAAASVGEFSAARWITARRYNYCSLISLRYWLAARYC